MSSEVVRPQSVEELGEVMAQAHARRVVVGFGGAGRDPAWTPRATPIELLVDITGLDRIVEHEAGDLTVTAEAGTTLAALQQRVASAGQWLGLDPPQNTATLGGIVSSAASGPRRLRYGTPRDLLIGITVVLADGTVAHSGGKVVKNVAGYDLGKLFTGARGTLGAVASTTFRLHPRPVDRRVVRLKPDDPARAVRTVLDCGVAPSAIELEGSTLTVLIDALESAASIQAEAVVAAVGGEISNQVPEGFGQRPWRPGEIGLKITHRLGALNETLALIDAEVPAPRVSAHAASGVVWVGFDGDLASVRRLRAAVAAYDGSVVVVAAPADADDAVDPWGPARGIEVMRRIKAQFDPSRLLAPGAFVGGI